MKKKIIKIAGTVEHGRRLGRKLGFPTANISLPEDFHEPLGVYLSQIEIKGKHYYALSSIGERPTIESGLKANLECYIFDFDSEIYGEPIEVTLLSYIRQEIRFSSVDELKEQIKKDIETASSLIYNL